MDATRAERLIEMAAGQSNGALCWLIREWSGETVECHSGMDYSTDYLIDKAYEAAAERFGITF